MRTAAARLILWLLALGVLLGGATVAAAPKSTTGAHRKRIADLADTIDGNIILSKFAKLVAASDMGTFYSSRGPFTLFAPTNSAFSKLPPGMFEDLLRPENKAQLQRIVLFHLVNGQAWTSKDLRMQKALVSCEGNPLEIKTTKAGTLFVHKAKVLRADQHCANGVIDEVDTLLMPPQLVLQAGPPVDASTNAAPDTNAPAAGTNAVPTDLISTPSDTNATPAAGTNAPTAP
jgi:uncharacterized surface protein with fasciclin (FAS1) repeats